MREKIYNTLIGTDINNIVLNCTDKLGMVARFVDEKIDDGLDDGYHLMMRSYDLTNRNGDKYYVRCYYHEIEKEITCVDVQVIEEKYDTPKKVAKELVFCPIVRVVIPTEVPNGYTENEYAEIVAKEKVRQWSKEEIIDWVFQNLEDVMEAIEPYDPENDD